MSNSIIANALEQLPKNREQVIAINIGAFDGRQNDPLYDFIAKYQWRAILVEPNPTSFAKLEANFADVAHVSLENVAIADVDGTMDFLVPILTGNEPSWFPQTASLSEEAMQQSIRLIRQEHKGTGNYTDMPQIERIPVQTLTPQSLIDNHQIEHFDALSVDAEGYDLKILQQINFGKYHPSVVIYEYYSLSYGDTIRSVRMLQRADYQCFWQSTDILAVRRDMINVSALEITWKNQLWYLFLRRFPLVTFIKNWIRDFRGVRR